jgi:hypothetical protein
VKGSSHFPAQLFGGDPAGLPAPEVHGQLPGQGDDGLFAFAGVDAGAEQDVFPFLDGAALGLEADHAPGQFDEQIPEPGVAVFGDGQVQVGLAAGTDPAAQAGERANLFAVVEAVPVGDFVGGAGQREGSQTQGSRFAGLGDDGFGQPGELLIQGGEHGAENVQALVEPGWQRGRQFGPARRPPPVAFDAMALGQHQAAAHGFEALAFTAELLALPADTTALFLLGGRDTNDGEGFAIAGQVAVQPADQGGGIGLVGVDPFAQVVEFHGADDEDLNAPGLELAGQAEAAGAGFIDGANGFGQGELLFDEPFQRWTGKDALGRLGAGAVELPDDAQIGGVLINAQQDPVAGRICRLRNRRDWSDVIRVSVGSHSRVMVNGVFHNPRCRQSRPLPTLMTSLDR